MQRSIINKNPLGAIVYLLLFFFYESLSSIYLFLPPLLAVLLVLFLKAMKDNDFYFVLYIGLYLIIFEADKGYIAFSSIFYFIFVYKFIEPKLVQNFNCSFCIKISYVLLAYLGFYLFTLLLSKIFISVTPELDYYLIYYLVIEFFLVSLL